MPIAKAAAFMIAALLCAALLTLPPAPPLWADEAEDAAEEAARLKTQLEHFIKTGRCVNCNLTGAVIGAGKLSGARLTNAALTGADLAGADLRGAELAKAQMSGADLSGANLAGANLKGADLSEANLSGADFWGAEIRRADLTKLKVDDTKGITEAEVGSSGKISIFDR